MKDELFKTPTDKPFEFNESVASVFDDMISRSVPHYKISSNLVCDFLNLMLESDAKIVDLGCSTATMLLKLFEKNPKFRLFGVDNSPSMIEIAQNKANAFGAEIKFSLADIMDADFKGADCVILNYTLQFIEPKKRPEFIKKIRENLNENGILIFSEKLIFKDEAANSAIREIYENYKISQGYSRFEIAQKRQALENVLIPLDENSNLKMLFSAGFRSAETLFKWGNFATYVASK